jgi:hypothetical protein
VKLEGEHVQGSPFKVSVIKPAKGVVTCSGPGLENGVKAGGSAKFGAKQAAPIGGDLKIDVKGPAVSAAPKVTRKGAGDWECEYFPKDPGAYDFVMVCVMLCDGVCDDVCE